MKNLTEDLRNDLVTRILDDSEAFNRTMRKNLESWRQGSIDTSRFLQLRNNAKGNALDTARRASRNVLV